MNGKPDAKLSRRPLDAILPTSLPAAVGLLLGRLALLLLFVGVLGWRGNLPSFLSPENLQGLLHDSTVTAVVALGMLMVIVSGGIDLSVGSVAALVTVVAMQVFRYLDAR